MKIGVFSTFIKHFAAPSSKGLTLATWNARAFCHYKADVAAQKCDYLGSTLRAGAIIGMQEVHGSAVRLRMLIDRTGLDYQMFYSFDDGANESLGGVATIFPYKLHDGLDVRAVLVGGLFGCHGEASA